MTRAVRIFLSIVLLALVFCSTAASAAEDVAVPVILYHRFGPTVADSMTTKTSVFEAQMKWLKDNGYTVIPMRTLVNYLLGQGPPPPPKSRAPRRCLPAPACVRGTPATAQAPRCALAGHPPPGPLRELARASAAPR